VSKGEVPENGRYGHTMNAWRDGVYVFGGSLFFRLGKRVCSNDMFIYNVKTFYWKKVKTNYIKPCSRKNHVSI